MNHPNIIDKLRLIIDSHYLYSEEMVQTISNLNVAIIHKVSSSYSKSGQWKIMDYLNLKKGSIIKYLGSGKQFKLKGDLNNNYSLFEIMNINSDKLTGNGDILALTKNDRKYLTKAPNILPTNINTPTYFTAEDQ